VQSQMRLFSSIVKDFAMSYNVPFPKANFYDTRNTQASVLGSNPVYSECLNVGFSRVFPWRRSVPFYIELIRPVYVGAYLDDDDKPSLRNVYVTNIDLED